MTLRDDSADPRPLPPQPPEAWECCQGGCDPCIHDVYQEALDRYEKAVAEWQSRQEKTNTSAIGNPLPED